MVESWEARNSSSQQIIEQSNGKGAPSLKIGHPSFFQSPSLVCMGGLGVLDPYETVQNVEKGNNDGSLSDIKVSDHVDATSGWRGMGLRGNHSYTNLHRSTSGGSGIFIGEDGEGDQDHTNSVIPKTGSWTSKVGGSDYIKVNLQYKSCIFVIRSKQ